MAVPLELLCELFGMNECYSRAFLGFQFLYCGVGEVRAFMFSTRGSMVRLLCSQSAEIHCVALVINKGCSDYGAMRSEGGYRTKNEIALT